MRFELIEGDGVCGHAAIPHGLCMVRQAVRHGLTAATEAQATIGARVLILMVSLLLWCCPYYTPCAQFLLSEVVLATAGRLVSRRLFAARRLSLQREAIERHGACNPFEHGGEWSGGGEAF